MWVCSKGGGCRKLGYFDLRFAFSWFGDLSLIFLLPCGVYLINCFSPPTKKKKRERENITNPHITHQVKG